MFYFLENDLRQLDLEIQKLRDRVGEDGQAMGEGCNQAAETYHDNAPYEEAVRSFQMDSKRLHELLAIRSRAYPTTRSSDTKRVQIGLEVDIEDVITGEQQTLEIGSHTIFDDKRVSYRSPIAKLIIGAPKGAVREGKVGKTVKQLKILDIRVPSNGS